MSSPLPPSPSQIIDRILHTPALTANVAKETCPICLETLTDSRATPCGHLFCNACIRRAISHGEDNCPYCRRPLALKTGILESYPLRMLLLELADRMRAAYMIICFTIFVCLYLPILVFCLLRLVAVLRGELELARIRLLAFPVFLASLHVLGLLVGGFRFYIKMLRAVRKAVLWRELANIVRSALEEAAAAA